MTQYHFTPDTYEQMIAEDLPAYGRLQEVIGTQTDGLDVSRFLDLGIGTGVTTSAILRVHQTATIVGVDMSREMLTAAEQRLREQQITLVEQRLQDPLPGGPYHLVVSALTIHHLDGPGKAGLFRRVFAELSPGGRFVFGDVVVPSHAVEHPTPLSADFDRPDAVDDQLDWLAEAGFVARCVWTEGDIAVLSATKPEAARVSTLPQDRDASPH